MLLRLHTYSLNLHGIGQAWDPDFKLPWPRQLSTFQLFDKIVDLDLNGVHPFVCLKMEIHWRSKPIGKVAGNLEFMKKMAEKYFTHNC